MQEFQSIEEYKSQVADLKRSMEAQGQELLKRASRVLRAESRNPRDSLAAVHALLQ